MAVGRGPLLGLSATREGAGGTLPQCQSLVPSCLDDSWWLSVALREGPTYPLFFVAPAVKVSTRVVVLKPGPVSGQTAVFCSEDARPVGTSGESLGSMWIPNPAGPWTQTSGDKYSGPCFTSQVFLFNELNHRKLPFFVDQKGSNSNFMGFNLTYPKVRPTAAPGEAGWGVGQSWEAGLEPGLCVLAPPPCVLAPPPASWPRPSPAARWPSLALVYSGSSTPSPHATPCVTALRLR